ncbi:MAG: hypothetical protein A3E87_04795 [Gammaproteobacteria bacterium RIFCSPHIGHO2_12_FULL_35_23]|nr:MAG: hypothetical protein A3E87_04795 [Gammaproteobacteria bacterium RIFCSPHIGHO2_12_FULL_35_23]
MNLLTAYQKLKVLAPTFLTKEAAGILNVSANHAAVILSRLAKQNTVVHLARGRWVYSDSVDLLLLPSILVHPMMAYVSLYSALYYHGMIEQIPHTIFAISNGKTKVFETPLGKVSIHSINPVLFTGYEIYGKNSVLMAIPEKALFDTLYLMPAKSNLFKRLTEMELPEGFRFELFDAWLKQVKNNSRCKIIEKNLQKIRYDKS